MEAVHGSRHTHKCCIHHQGHLRCHVYLLAATIKNQSTRQLRISTRPHVKEEAAWLSSERMTTHPVEGIGSSSGCHWCIHVHSLGNHQSETVKPKHLSLLSARITLVIESNITHHKKNVDTAATQMKTYAILAGTVTTKDIRANI